MALLEIRDLRVWFSLNQKFWTRTPRVLRAVDGVSLSIDRGETLGLVGESGCGKTTLGRAVLRLLKPNEGRIELEGEDIAQFRGRKLREFRRKVQMIFQDPFGSLDPRQTVEQSVAEPLIIHRLSPNRTARRERVARLLTDVGLSVDSMQRYPHEFSGGQRQRIGIARALAVEPNLIVCDEPVSALDVSVQAQVVNLLKDLQEQRSLSYLFVAHDLAVVQNLSNRILVMYLGKPMELGAASDVCRKPRHPYTQALIAAVPSLERPSLSEAPLLSGETPSPINPPPGCPFHPRCPMAEERCRIEPPAWREVAPSHWAACHFA